MRCLEKNKTTFYYSNFIRTEQIVDEDGFKTGEQEEIFDNPKKARANISPADGSRTYDRFGTLEDYDKVIALSKDDYDIKATTILWIDTVPELRTDGSLKKDLNGDIITPNDYIVKGIRTSLNNVLVAVSKVR